MTWNSPCVQFEFLKLSTNPKYAGKWFALIINPVWGNVAICLLEILIAFLALLEEVKSQQYSAPVRPYLEIMWSFGAWPWTGKSSGELCGKWFQAQGFKSLEFNGLGLTLTSLPYKLWNVIKQHMFCSSTLSCRSGDLGILRSENIHKVMSGKFHVFYHNS